MKLYAAMATLVVMATCAPAHAQSNCGVHGDVVEFLEESYEEQKVASGMFPNNTAMEIFASDTGSWTMLQTRASGMSCIVAAGDMFGLWDMPKGEEM